jgi:hypothetical protein
MGNTSRIDVVVVAEVVVVEGICSVSIKWMLAVSVIVEVVVEPFSSPIRTSEQALE